MAFDKIDLNHKCGSCYYYAPLKMDRYLEDRYFMRGDCLAPFKRRVIERARTESCKKWRHKDEA